MSAQILNYCEKIYDAQCSTPNCAGCLGEERYSTTYPLTRAPDARPNEYVIPWESGVCCTITTCEEFAKRARANQEFVRSWHAWLKIQTDANVPIENIVRHRFCPIENIPPVEWLRNPENFKNIRNFLFLGGSGPESDAAITYGKNPKGGPFDGIFEQNDRVLEEFTIMKYIYGRYHFALIQTEIFRTKLSYLSNLRDELEILDIYYGWFGNVNDDNIEDFMTGGAIDLCEYEKQQQQRDIELKAKDKNYQRSPRILRPIFNLTLN